MFSKRFYKSGSSEKPFVSTCIVGAQRRERIVENARSFDQTIPPEDWVRLDEAVKNLFRKDESD